MNGLNLEQSARIAARFVSASISATAVNPDASWYGVEFEGQIPTLLSLLDKPATGRACVAPSNITSLT